MVPACAPVSLIVCPPAEIATANVVPFFNIHAVSLSLALPELKVTVTLSVVELR